MLLRRRRRRWRHVGRDSVGERRTKALQGIGEVVVQIVSRVPEYEVADGSADDKDESEDEKERRTFVVVRAIGAAATAAAAGRRVVDGGEGGVGRHFEFLEFAILAGAAAGGVAGEEVHGLFVCLFVCFACFD